MLLQIESSQFLGLTTAGRKSGKKHPVPLIFVLDDGKYAIVACDTPPVWWLNFESEPNASIEILGTTTAVDAAEASQADHYGLWPELTEIYPTYDEYVTRTQRPSPASCSPHRASEPSCARPPAARDSSLPPPIWQRVLDRQITLARRSVLASMLRSG